MNPDVYALHDLTQFPVVLTRRPLARQDTAHTWTREMEWLAASPGPFVLIGTDLNVDMAPAERREVVAWQAANMQRLRQRCAGFISVVPDPRAYGLPFFAVPTLAQARDKARELLLGFPGGYGHAAAWVEADRLAEA
ncbi:hypothetical protein [Bordetella petrii]|uniref:hypothetical protein n=1 Tax=Bordetella petrii TaxID=94624 RepID=UPI001E383F8F|nr:hypothetical protein [Bordetella petrii]MCD0502905.1 hypothetical protein [Bordetella petrii]